MIFFLHLFQVKISVVMDLEELLRNHVQVNLMTTER